MRTLREAGESRLVQIGIRGSIVTRRDGPLIARHAASHQEPKCCYRVFGLSANHRPQSLSPVATSQKTTLRKFAPAPASSDRHARLRLGTEFRVRFERLLRQPEAMQNDRQLSGDGHHCLAFTALTAALG